MAIEIHEPELEALIHERMHILGFQTVEEFLMHSLREPKIQESTPHGKSGFAGADLPDAVQSRPDKDLHLGTFRSKVSLAKFLRDSPLPGSGLILERTKDYPEPIDL